MSTPPPESDRLVSVLRRGTGTPTPDLMSSLDDFTFYGIDNDAVELSQIKFMAKT